MDFQRGLKTIDPSAASDIVETAMRADLPIFVVETGEGVGREAFFDAVRAVMPLDPPVLSSRSWEALSDSMWEGIRTLDAERVIILWTNATAFKSGSRSEYELSIQVLGDLAGTLADPRATSGRPTELSILVGMAPGT